MVSDVTETFKPSLNFEWRFCCSRSKVHIHHPFHHDGSHATIPSSCLQLPPSAPYNRTGIHIVPKAIMVSTIVSSRHGQETKKQTS